MSEKENAPTWKALDAEHQIRQLRSVLDTVDGTVGERQRFIRHVNVALYEWETGIGLTDEQVGKVQTAFKILEVFGEQVFKERLCGVDGSSIAPGEVRGWRAATDARYGITRMDGHEPLPDLKPAPESETANLRPATLSEYCQLMEVCADAREARRIKNYYAQGLEQGPNGEWRPKG